MDSSTYNMKTVNEDVPVLSADHSAKLQALGQTVQGLSGKWKKAMAKLGGLGQLRAVLATQ